MTRRGGEGADFAETERLVNQVTNRRVQAEQVDAGRTVKTARCRLVDEVAEQAEHCCNSIGCGVVGQIGRRKSLHALRHGQVGRAFFVLRTGTEGNDGNREGT